MHYFNSSNRYDIYYSEGFFKVSEKEYKGVYDTKGNCIIPTSRMYIDLYVKNENNFRYITFWKGERKKKYRYSSNGLCDIHGNELISSDRGYTQLYMDLKDEIPYVKVFKEKKQGVCNANGKEIIPPIYRIFWYDRSFYGKNKRLGISLYDDNFNYDKHQFAIDEKGTPHKCGETICNYDFFGDLVEIDGLYGAVAHNGTTIVPIKYNSVQYHPRGNYSRFYVQENNNIGVYDPDGRQVIPTSRGYSAVFWHGGWYSITKGGKHGACDAEGNEIIEPIYEGLFYDNRVQSLVYKDSNGNYINSGIQVWDAEEEERKTEEEKRKAAEREKALMAQKKAEKQERTARVISAIASGVANAYANVLAQQAARPNVPSYSPSKPANSYAGSSSYSTSPAYLAQVQARADRSMANYQAQLQRIGQQTLANNQQMMNRCKNMFSDMSNWSFRFRSQNGREPTDLEKSQWVKQHYPDMYASYVQAQAAQYERTSTNTSSDDEPTESKKEISNTYDCSYCGGTGRLLQEDETLSFGLSAEKDYKCQECGKWKYKGKTHRHYNCTHCKGSGKVTFK